MSKYIVFAAAALFASGTAFAQAGPPADPYGDATVSKAEVEQAAGQRFDQFDGNKDGRLSADEISAAAQAGGGRGLARADGDGDGVVSKAEFVASQTQRFDTQDGDKDGQLTKAERDAARQQMMNRGGGRGGGGGGGGDGRSGGQ